MAAADGELTIGRNTPSKVNGAPSPLASVSLSRDHITDAFKKSPDNGVTFDLTYKNLTDVGEDGAEELATIGQGEDARGESTVVRIALAHNRLTTLPMAFALLSRLRYLVLKNNNFTIFPDVLTIMPSLEILDISRNKIKRLPSQPGSLTKLRVFSLFRNKIHRLPAYFSQFQHLNIFKVDQNPLEWPPRDVMEPPSSGDNADAMKDWIRSVQKWIEINSITTDRKVSEEFLFTESFMDFSGKDHPGDETDAKSPFDMSLFMETSSIHQRTLSMESGTSRYSDHIFSPGGFEASRSPNSPRPPRLHLAAVSNTRSTNSSVSPLRSPDSYLPTPEESVSSTDEDANRLTGHPQLHGRNASFAGQALRPPRNVLAAKKSLPDLRPAKLSLHNHNGHGRALDDQSGIPSPPHRQESDSSSGSLPNFHVAKFSPSGVVSSPVSLHRPAPHMDGERHQYFRRISQLNPGSLMKTIPPTLLTLVDAIRGILFGVSQIYQTLQHYTEYAIDERFSTVLLKVLDPASTYMNQLIHALDRFDSMSKRTIPPPSVCRAVVEMGRDNVIVFGKAIGVLTLQLKVLATHDDVRYTRQMLLVLYGAMAEIAGAWKTIATQIDSIKPFLSDVRPPPVSKGFATTTALHEGIQTPSTPGSTKPNLPLHPASRSLARSNSNGANARTKLARRHAGSFSYKDVEIGMMLPSNAESPTLATGLVGGSGIHTPVLRTVRRAATSFVASGRDSRNDGTIRPSISTAARGDMHARQNSLTSPFMTASTSSPSLGGVPRTPSLEAMSSTVTLMDGDAVDAIKKALEAAHPVWKLTDELLRDDPAAQEALSEPLIKAKEVTARLQEDIRFVAATDTANRKALHDDAHAFANIVIQLLNAIKTYGASRTLSPALRASMVKLTNATQSFVMLVHVSSFSPAPMPRPYSPMVGVNTGPPKLIVEDGRLGASLSRSRSAIAAGGTRILPPMKEPPRSALPQATFALAPPNRLPAVPS